MFGTSTSTSTLWNHLSPSSHKRNVLLWVEAKSSPFTTRLLSGIETVLGYQWISHLYHGRSLPFLSFWFVGVHEILYFILFSTICASSTSSNDTWLQAQLCIEMNKPKRWWRTEELFPWWRKTLSQQMRGCHLVANMVHGGRNVNRTSARLGNSHVIVSLLSLLRTNRSQ